MLSDDVAVEECLEVIIAVVGNLCGVEDGFDIGHRTEMTGTGLVVDDADALLTSSEVGDTVETVDDTTDLCLSPRHGYTFFEAEDGERCQTAVGLDKQTHIFDHHLAVDKLETVENHGDWSMIARAIRITRRVILILKEFGADGGIDGALNGDFVFEEVVEHHGGDATTGKWLVERLGSLVEDVAEETVVDEVFVGVVGFLKVADVTVEEAELTAQVGADGRGTDAATVFGEALVEDVEDDGGLIDGLWLAEEGGLPGAEGAEGDISSLHHQL